jgi:hypothetical protein
VKANRICWQKGRKILPAGEFEPFARVAKRPLEGRSFVAEKSSQHRHSGRFIFRKNVL